jgi:hypothetical protein
MTTLTTYTSDDILSFFAIQWLDHEEADEMVAENVRAVNTWLGRGDGIAVYENHDLGHPGLGHKVFLSFGSPDAQIESDDLPQFCPIQLPHGLMHWRYVLVGTYRGDSL